MRSHGTRSAYVGGCRCEPCQQANRDYQRVYMAATRVHATESNYSGHRRKDGSIRFNLAPLRPRRVK